MGLRGWQPVRSHISIYFRFAGAVSETTRFNSPGPRGEREKGSLYLWETTKRYKGTDMELKHHSS